MMHRAPLSARRILLEQGKVGHPKKIELLEIGQLLDVRNPQAQPAKHFARDCPFIGGKKDEIAFFDSKSLLQRLSFGIAEKL